MYTQTNNIDDKSQKAVVDTISGLLPYPIDLLAYLTLSPYVLDDSGVPYDGGPAGYHPATIAQYALAHWNRYLVAGSENHREIFLTQANWLIEHELRMSDDAGGWPITVPHPDVRDGDLYLSAPAQGNALSVLVRAYQLTQKEVFLKVVRRVVRTFERDILDGGVGVPIGEDGVFFEEVAVYPAAHKLSGVIFTLFGFYDYVTLTDDAIINEIIQRCLKTIHLFLDEYDVGFWTRTDLLHRQLATPAHLALQAKLLEALATYTGCEHCLIVASRWKRYQQQPGSRLRYLIARYSASFRKTLLSRVRSLLFPKAAVSKVLRICVPITGFPLTGGMRAVLAKIAQVTSDLWQMEYLTQNVGPKSDKFITHRFGMASMSPWQFPMVWLYCLAGLRKLISLLRRGADYDVILPQDGVFTAAFAAPIAKLAGMRVVCIDHGNLLLLKSHTYRTERIRSLEQKHWARRLTERLLFMCYWPSLYSLAWFAAHFVDHYLVPGVAGDGVEEVCRSLRVGPSRLTRFVNSIDVDRHIVPDAASRADIREKNGIPADAIVITMICRLAPEKGLDIALEVINQALSALSPDQHARVRVIIAGDGPLQKQLETDISIRKLDQTCILWGEASEETVISLLGMSDIFLFTSRRASGYPVAVLEAMASRCATIATNDSIANMRALAEGRGMTVAIGDVEQTVEVLLRLLNDPELRRQMGTLARNYIAEKHSPMILRRAMMRATCWVELGELLKQGTETGTVHVEVCEK